MAVEGSIHRTTPNKRMFFKWGKPTPGNMTEDSELLRMFKQEGSLIALSTLYQRYTHLVFGVCLKYLKDEEPAKDAVMQIFEKLVNTLPRHEVHNFKSWLHTLTRNHCLMELRAAKGKKTVGTNGLFEGEAMENKPALHPVDIDDGDFPEEAIAALESALPQIPNDQRLCIELFYLQEKCYKEVAEETGFTLNQVKSHIQNGKRNLKNILMKLREA